VLLLISGTFGSPSPGAPKIRMGPHGLSCESFVRRQVELSRDLLSLDAPSEAHSEENDA
jgi:hypothetical protein